MAAIETQSEMVGQGMPEIHNEGTESLREQMQFLTFLGLAY